MIIHIQFPKCDSGCGLGLQQCRENCYETVKVHQSKDFIITFFFSNVNF